MLLRKALLVAQKQLRSAGVRSEEASSIIQVVTGLSKEEILSDGARVLVDRDVNMIKYFVSERLRRVPLPYLTGKSNFYRDTFLVGTNVLCPRKETEVLVDSTMHAVESLQTQKNSLLTVVDAGTGSGCIACSVKKYSAWPIHMLGVDMSFHALEVAKHNARNLDVDVSFLQSSWLSAFSADSLDIIVSNPPYLSSFDWKNCEPELSYEPYTALVGGTTGTEMLKQIIESSIFCLRTGGVLLLEHGKDQIEQVKNLLEKNGWFFYALPTINQIAAPQGLLTMIAYLTTEVMAEWQLHEKENGLFPSPDRI
uniref:peptide chain release factor N(5)-glutamine methyltransferase n=2 Tax=Palpitomonas bilix TaxID=652834 RepID=A0A7S3LWW7_9EUKA|mmetsp:Transcript_7111/g.18346  ORF Transcript_7111/g.18346 Transcript_7111/m.18346 type:complete len:310 (+) Transcript_7111:291-1220(+)